MSSIAALVGFALWALALVCGVGLCRVVWVLVGKFRPNGFPSGQEHGPDWYWRLNRAHMNTVENLPIFGALVLAAWAAEVQVDLAATVVLAARIGQTLFHVSSNRSLVVNLRFTCFLTQVIAMAVIGLKVLGALL